MIESNGRQRPKAFFFDVDGTLFSSKTKQVPESARYALKMAKKNGVLLFAATGRHKQYLKGIKGIGEFGFSGFVTLNGQYCYGEREEVVYKNPIDTRDVGSLLDCLENAPAACAFLEDDLIYINFLDNSVRKSHEQVGTPLPELRDVRRARDHDIYQISLYKEDNSEILRLMPHCAYTHCVEGGIDIMPSSGGKWVGISRMLDHFDIETQDTVTFGDGENDIKMLSGAGFSVAMGNAKDEVKAAACAVTDHIDDDGVYNAIRRFWPDLL